jgi:hypothetical protein
MQLISDPSRSVSRIMSGYGFEITFQAALVNLLALVVVTAAGKVHQLASHPDRILMPLHQTLYDHSPSLGAEPEFLNTFFAMSNCIVSRPTIRSNSAMRSCSWVPF